MKGIVTFYSNYRGYGFISGSDKNEYFVHVSQLNTDDLKSLEKGQEVSFTPLKSIRGFKAGDVVVTTVDDSLKTIDRQFTLKKNPFTPQSPIINARKFAGRREQILNAIDALFNNKNILILGPRGIGKSSLTYQLMYLTKGNTELIDKLGVSLGGFKFNNLTGDHRCVPGNNLVDICNGLISTFCDSIGIDNNESKRKTICGIDIKIFKFVTEKEDEHKKISPSDVSLAFVSKIEELVKLKGDVDKNVTFAIDEIDVIDQDIDIAPFLKSTSEKFQLDKKLNASFIVSGVTGTITNLISQHQSVSRLFENLSIPKMQHHELEEIIDSSLEGTGVDISAESKAKIITLSNFFPQPVHLLGYHAFKIDTDNSISIDDVIEAESVIVSDIKKQDFESRFDRIAPGGMTEIIRVFAQAPQETVNIPYLKANLRHMDEDKIIGTIGRLQEQGIIEKQHRFIYRFHDPLFKVYLRWLFGIGVI
jgi:cold shock CspA family protein